MRSRFFTILAMVVFVCAAPAFAQCHPINSVPFTINQPGLWCLTADLTYTDLGRAIGINVSNVTLDLGGYRITSGSSAFGVGAVDVSHIIVRNGSLSGGYAGVEIFTSNTGTSNDVLLENLQVDGFANVGLYVIGNDSTIRNCIIRSPSSSLPYGIWANSNDIDHVTINGVASGMYVYGPSPHTVRNCVVTAGTGVSTNGGYSSIINNDITATGGWGVYVNSAAAAVIGNRISSTSVPITASLPSVKYRDNIFLNNTSAVGGTNEGNNQ